MLAMIYLDEKGLHFSLNLTDDLLSFQECRGRIIVWPEERQNENFAVHFDMTREAMFTFGLNCIYLADSEMYLGNRTDPIGEFETVSMGLHLTPDCDSLFIYQTQEQDSFESMLSSDSPSKFRAKVQYLRDSRFSQNDRHKQERQFCVALREEGVGDLEAIQNAICSLATLKIYDNYGNKVNYDTIFYLNKHGLLGLGITLIRLAHQVKTGQTFTVAREGDIITDSLNTFPGVTLAKDSASLTIGCVELPNWFVYQEQLKADKK